ncbi:MAG: hypothetical protein NUV61_02005 [Candidatus Azambacteria bacterium]|nr:hypothetical protein [Candidatus Azambacteria bacterium]
MSQIIFKVAGHPESELVFYPETSCGGIRQGVGFANGRKNGGWVIAYKDLLEMAKLAKEARRPTKRAHRPDNRAQEVKDWVEEKRQ